MARNVFSLLALGMAFLQAHASDISWKELRQFGTDEFRHADDIRSICLSPDGKLIATSSARSCFIWDADTGKLIHRFDREFQVRCAAFMPDGRHVLCVVGHNDKLTDALVLLDVNTGTELWQMPTEQRWVRNLYLAPDGRTAITSDGAAGITIIDLEHKVTLRREKGNHEPICWSPKSDCFVCNQDEHLTVVEVPGFKVRWASNARYGSGLGVTFSSDAKQLIRSSSTETTVFDAVTGDVINTFGDKSSRFWFHDILPLPDGETIVGRRGVSLFLWNVSTGKVLNHIETSGQSLAVSPDGKWVAMRFNYLIQRWDLSSGKVLQMPRGHMGSIRRTAVSPDGKLLASCSGDAPGRGAFDDGTVRVWNIQTGEELHCFKTDAYAGAGVLFTSDNKTLYAAAEFDNNGASILKAWAMPSGNELFSSKINGRYVTDMQFSEDQKNLIVSTCHTISVLNPASGEELSRFNAGTQLCSILPFGNGRWIIGIDGGYWTESPGEILLRIIDAKTGKELRYDPSDDEPSHYCNFSSLKCAVRGRRFLAGCRASWLTDKFSGENAGLLFYRQDLFLQKVTQDDIKSLVVELGDNELDRRDKATEHLLKLGPAARRALEMHLKDDDPEIGARLTRIFAAYDRAELPQFEQALDAGGSVYTVDVGPDGKLFIASVERRKDYAYELCFGSMPDDKNGTKVPAGILSRILALRNPQSITILPGGNQFITGNADGTLTLYGRE